VQAISRVSNDFILRMDLILDLLPYKGELIKGLEGTQARSKDLRESRKEVGDLLRRYNEFVSHLPYLADQLELTGRPRQCRTYSSNCIIESSRWRRR
jgi:hypothetical protein